MIAGAWITRERVTGGTGTRTYPTDFSPLISDRQNWGHVYSFGEVSCHTHCIEQNVVAIRRRSVAPSLRFALPQPEFGAHYSRMAEHYGSLAEAEERGLLAYGR